MPIDQENALVTLAESKEYCGVPAGSTEFDGVLEAIINAVSVGINRYTKRKIKQRLLSELYDGDGKGVILLRNYPVDPATPVVVTDDKLGEIPVALVDYEAGIVLLKEPDSRGIANVTVAYKGGYTEIPADLKQAALDQIKYQFFRWRNNREGMTTVSYGGESVQYAEQGRWLPAVKEVIDQYRRQR